MIEDHSPYEAVIRLSVNSFGSAMDAQLTVWQEREAYTVRAELAPDEDLEEYDPDSLRRTLHGLLDTVTGAFRPVWPTYSTRRIRALWRPSDLFPDSEAYMVIPRSQLSPGNARELADLLGQALKGPLDYRTQQ